MPFRKHGSRYDGGLELQFKAFVPSAFDSSASRDSASEKKDRSSSHSLAASVGPDTQPKKVQVPTDVSDALLSKGLYADKEGVVRWMQDSTRSVHPRRWSILRKSYDSGVICLMEFVMTLVSNTGSSIATEAKEDLGITLGGLMFPPLAESFGGRTIYVSSTVAFAAACLVLGACPKLPAVIVVRFVTGLISAIPAVVAASSIENMWDTKARIWVIHIWICAAVLGLAIAPAIATVVSKSHLHWHWNFHIAAAMTVGVALMCLGTKESRPSQLLEQQIKNIKRRTNYSELYLDGSDTPPNMKTFVRTSLTLPVRLFFTEPIVFATSIMVATIVGVIYLFSAALPEVYMRRYEFTPLNASLVSVSIAIGVVFTFLPRLYDQRVVNRKGADAIEPEDKLMGFYVAAPVLAIGLWWFAFTVPPLVNGVSARASIASLALFGYAVVEFNNVLSGYLCDTYASYAASAIAPLSFLRAILGGVFPLFGEQMFRLMGPNNAMFLIASVATIFCGVAALFRVYGKTIRERSLIAESTRTATARGSGEANV